MVSGPSAAAAGLELPVPLPRAFFDRSSLEVAPELLGCVLWHQLPAGTVAVVITEVEAYAGSADPASHSYRGRTRRNGVMFGPPGHAYVYFTYGMHFCANLVCQVPGDAAAVLLRAGRVSAGAELAAARRLAARPARSAADGPGPRALAERDLARGPARLCQALAIDQARDGADVCAPGGPLLIAGPAGADPASISTGPRVGVSQAADRPWRFWITGDPTVSVYRPAVPRRRPG